ncbi:unnamed protein product [Menidia menidia]|uniref:(Atlantic silverside) hypothetical protein n=1 Tax=Menidia menidia TaxID=238744 RepID=A0A8S4A9Z6_9TELE|nr:unnamed protein product [Menidia menidia]
MADAGRPANSSLVLCPSAATLYFIPSVYGLLFLTALPGNALSLWVFRRRVSPVSPVHVYLSHLSASNLLLCVAAPFLAAYHAGGRAWPLRGPLCLLALHGLTPLLYVSLYIGLLILAWVALSRFAALVQRRHASAPRPGPALLPRGLSARLKRAPFAGAVCAAMWALTLGSVVPVSVYYSAREVVGSAGEGGRCYSLEVELGGATSAVLTVSAVSVFFLLYLLVLLSYVTVLRQVRRSRRSTRIPASQSLLTRVFRNIVVIQVVLSVCLLPYHIFKPIFFVFARNQPQVPDDGSGCHPLSAFVEVKNGLFLLAALRGSTDPVMFFLLDRSFRLQTLELLKPSRKKKPRRQDACCSTTENTTQKVEAGNTAKASSDTGHGSAG